MRLTTHQTIPMEKTRAKPHDGKQDHHHDIDGGDQNVTVVMKMDMHCDECVGKLVKHVKSLHGVKSVAAGGDCKELTVSGTMDPCQLRRLLEEKTKKKTILFSLVTNVAESPTDDVESQIEGKSEGKPAPAPAPTKTVVLRMALHCNGCMKKIMKKLLTFEGVTAVTGMNLGNDLVTVVGNFDVKSLVTFLSHKLRRRVEVIEENVNPSPATKSSDGVSATRKSSNKGSTAKTNKGSSTGESVEKPSMLNSRDGNGRCVTGEIPKTEEEEVVVASLVLKRAKNGGSHRLVIGKGETNHAEKNGKEETTTVAAATESRGHQAEMQEARGYNHISCHVDMAYASELFSDDNTTACCIM